MRVSILTSTFAWARNSELLACEIFRPCHVARRWIWERRLKSLWKLYKIHLRLQCYHRASNKWEKQRCLRRYKVSFSQYIIILWDVVKNISLLTGYRFSTIGKNVLARDSSVVVLKGIEKAKYVRELLRIENVYH